MNVIVLFMHSYSGCVLCDENVSDNPWAYLFWRVFRDVLFMGKVYISFCYSLENAVDVLPFDSLKENLKEMKGDLIS